MLPEKPQDSRFTQLELSACKPILTPKWVISSFMLVSIVFIPIGLVPLFASRDYHGGTNFGRESGLFVTTSYDYDAPLDEYDSSELKDDDSRFHLKTTAELLKCDEQALEDSLCKRVMVTRDDTITKFLDPGSAAVSRDALAKIVYSRLFDW
ncbi:hypothetical protein POM88_028439 [Heracleum sosnowskyi]|uniref:beta-galactosidase n=1 Tax=Heracleum sosnowskyi TaxID=360622 RepID=A0AAD8HS86_9APIA|nr:hypothetical protein POM88_028439 [Heracleum sosnowskyi]